MFEIKNIKYHRNKESIDLNQAQALLLVGDIINVALNQNGFTADITIKDNDKQ
jgi:uncharacterized protein (UPF0218 family)